jgi:hypothetical protein
VFGEMALFGQPAPVTVTADPDESTTVLELDLLYVLALISKPNQSSARPLATGLLYSVALSLWTTLAALQSAAVPKVLPDGHLDRVNEGTPEEV